MRWGGWGTIDKKDYSMLYSGPNKRNGRHRIGFFIITK